MGLPKEPPAIGRSTVLVWQDLQLLCHTIACRVIAQLHTSSQSILPVSVGVRKIVLLLSRTFKTVNTNGALRLGMSDTFPRSMTCQCGNGGLRACWATTDRGPLQ